MPTAEEAAAIEVDLTSTAVRRIKALRGGRATAARQALEEVLDRGCAAAGYRPAAPP